MGEERREDKDKDGKGVRCAMTTGGGWGGWHRPIILSN